MMSSASNSLADITAKLHTLAKRSTADMLTTGRLLCEAKACPDLGGQKFGEWCKREFAWDQRTAQRYMRAFKWYDNLDEKKRLCVVSGLTQSAVYAMTDERPCGHYLTPDAAAAVLEAAHDEVLALADTRRVGATEVYALVADRLVSADTAACEVGQPLQIEDDDDLEQSADVETFEGDDANTKVDLDEVFEMQRQMQAQDRAIRQAAGITLDDRTRYEAGDEDEDDANEPTPIAIGRETGIQLIVTELLLYEDFGPDDIAVCDLNPAEIAKAVEILNRLLARIRGGDAVKLAADRPEARSAAATAGTARPPITIDGCTLDHADPNVIPRTLCRACTGIAS